MWLRGVRVLATISLNFHVITVKRGQGNPVTSKLLKQANSHVCMLAIPHLLAIILVGTKLWFVFFLMLKFSGSVTEGYKTRLIKSRSVHIKEMKSCSALRRL